MTEFFIDTHNKNYNPSHELFGYRNRELIALNIMVAAVPELSET